MGVLGGLGLGWLGGEIDKAFGGDGSIGKTIGGGLGSFLPFEQGGVVAMVPRTYEMVGGVPQKYNPNTPMNKGLIGMPNPFAQGVKIDVMHAEKGGMAKKRRTAKKEPAKPKKRTTKKK